MIVAVRGDGDPAALAGTLRREAGRLDPDVAVARIATLSSLAAESIAPQRFGAVLLAMFASAAVLLAAIGVYGVMSYAVTQRRHDIGVRLALGASPRDVFVEVLARGLTLAGAGAVIGLAAAVAVGPLMQSLLSGVSPTDPLTLLAVPLVIVAVALLACAVPGRRAAHIPPLEALRQ
jgi:putative ABC transport system permease protein